MQQNVEIPALVVDHYGSVDPFFLGEMQYVNGEYGKIDGTPLWMIPANEDPPERTEPFVAAVGKTIPLTLYSHLKINRPNSTLATPMQLRFPEYLDKAFICTDGQTDVPRLIGQANHGKWKINDQIARQTGIVNANWRFTATEPGKTLVTTMADSDGYYGEATVYAIDLKVDSNHDGVIDESDRATYSTPFRFWVNNNRDRSDLQDKGSIVGTEEGTLIEDDYPASSRFPNSDASYTLSSLYPPIPCRKDLEDYSRLQIAGLSALLLNLPTGWDVRLRFQAQSKSTCPGILLVPARDKSTAYLTDKAFAIEQTKTNSIGEVIYGQPLSLRDADARLRENGGALTDYFLFCGETSGRGDLTLEVIDDAGSLLASESVYMRLNDITEFFERYTVGDYYANPAGYPTAAHFAEDCAPGTIPFRYPTPTADDPLIFFVHGWNMDVFTKNAFASTMYKRLYWAGYHGRFAAFRWPTDWNFPHGFQWLELFSHFNDSELQALRSAAPLKGLLQTLNLKYPGKLHVLGHSHGNVVISEAIHLARPNKLADTYSMCQAALSAGAYDEFYPQDLSFVQNGLVHGPDTPDIYHGKYADNLGTGVKIHRFYNPTDWAFRAELWQLNQLLKPSASYWGFFGGPDHNTQSYHSADDADVNHFFQNVGHSTPGVWVFFDMNNLDSLYQITAYAAESRTLPLATAAVVGNLTDDYNLQDIWKIDDQAAPPKSFTAHKWHSAQWRSTFIEQGAFYRKLLSVLELH